MDFYALAFIAVRPVSLFRRAPPTYYRSAVLGGEVESLTVGQIEAIALVAYALKLRGGAKAAKAKELRALITAEPDKLEAIPASVSLGTGKRKGPGKGKGRAKPRAAASQTQEESSNSDDDDDDDDEPPLLSEDDC